MCVVDDGAAGRADSGTEHPRQPEVDAGEALLGVGGGQGGAPPRPASVPSSASARFRLGSMGVPQMPRVTSNGSGIGTSLGRG